MRCWLFEQRLLQVRWFALAIGAALLPFVPANDRAPVLGALTLLAVANAGLAHLLETAPATSRFRAARWLATAIEWSGTLAVIAIRSAEARIAAAGLLLLVLVIDGARHRLVGLALATLAGWLTLAALAAVRAFAYDVLAPGEAWTLAIERGALLGIAAFVIGALIVESDEERRFGQARHMADLHSLQTQHAMELQSMLARHEAELYSASTRCDETCAALAEQHMAEQRVLRAQLAAELDEYRRERAGLSLREWELLELLAEDMTYEQAAERMGVELDTAKTYLKRMNAKLGMHGRREIVALARERGWLDDRDDATPR